MSFFEYHASFTSGITRIEWQGDITVIPTEAARAVIARNYARYLTDLEIAAWNDAVDQYEEQVAKEAEKKAAEAPKPTTPPVPEPKQAVAPVPPAKPAGEEKAPEPKLTPEQEAALKKAEEEADKGKSGSTEE